jgi:ketopantoate reductase
VDKIVANPILRSMASTIMDEASAIGNAELLETHGEGNFKPLGATEKNAMMDWCDGVGEFAPSTLVDFLNGHQMELRYLFQEPILRGRRLNIPCPVLEAVVAQIESLAKTPRSNCCTAKNFVFVDRVPFTTVDQNVIPATLLLHTA